MNYNCTVLVAYYKSQAKIRRAVNTFRYKEVNLINLDKRNTVNPILLDTRNAVN